MSNVPNINQIFDDLDRFRNYCRFEGKYFDERDLYNNGAPVWEAYKKYRNYLRAKAKAEARGIKFQKR